MTKWRVAPASLVSHSRSHNHCACQIGGLSHGCLLNPAWKRRQLSSVRITRRRTDQVIIEHPAGVMEKSALLPSLARNSSWPFWNALRLCFLLTGYTSRTFDEVVHRRLAPEALRLAFIRSFLLFAAPGEPCFAPRVRLGLPLHALARVARTVR